MGRSQKILQDRLQSDDQLAQVPNNHVKPVDIEFSTADDTAVRQASTNQSVNQGNNTEELNSWKCRCDPDATTESSSVYISHWDDLKGNSKTNEEFQEFRLHDGSNSVYLLMLLLFVILIVMSIIPMTTVFPPIPFTKCLVLYYIVALFVVITLAMLKIVSVVRYLLYGNEDDKNHYEEMSSKKKRKRKQYHDENSAIASIQHYLQQVDPRVKAVDQSGRIQGYLEVLCATMVVGGLVLYCTYMVVLTHDYGVVGRDLPNVHSLPEGLVAASVLIPLLLYMVFKQLHFRHALILIVGAFSASMVLSGIYSLNVTVPRGIMGVITSLFMLCEYHRQCWHSFLISNRLMKSLDENTRLAEEVKANELRHMIGNVAHDLKTPLSSFIGGMEVIRLVANELHLDMKQSHSTPTNHITAMQDKISTILEVAENVTNTNAFMIMTINRCIDYNKTLFGLKLLPKNEIFALKDSIECVIKCLQGLHNQDSLSIECIYKSPELRFGEVILKTDKQWIQENLLCLIGNAVKYTPPGRKVGLELSLVPRNRDFRIDSVYGINSEQSSSTLPILTMSTINRVSNDNRAIVDRPINYDVEQGFVHDESNVATDLTDLKESSRDGKLFMMVKENSSISTAVSSSEFFLRIEVIDGGPGVDIQFRSKLFQEPVQAARLSGGTGLGLYSLARRVETIGGEYGISNRADGQQGSVFWFMIPFHPQHQSINSSLIEGTSIVSVGSEPQRKQALWEVPSVRVRQDLSNHESGTDSSKHHAASGNESVCDQNHHIRRYSIGSSDEPSIASSVGNKNCIVYLHENDGNYGRLASRSSESSSPKHRLEPNLPVAPTHVDGIRDCIVENSQNLVCPILCKPEIPKNLKVLVVDDSLPILKMTSLALRKQGHQVITAENGVEAIKIFQDNLASYQPWNGIMESSPFDVVLMDFQMPIMDGIQAITKLRELERQQAPVIKVPSPRSQTQPIDEAHVTQIKCKEVIIIGFSAKSDEYQIEDGYLRGMDAFLPKPFTISSFHGILVNVLENRYHQESTI